MGVGRGVSELNDADEASQGSLGEREDFCSVGTRGRWRSELLSVSSPRLLRPHHRLRPAISFCPSPRLARPTLSLAHVHVAEPKEKGAGTNTKQKLSPIHLEQLVKVTHAVMLKGLRD